MTTLNKLFWEHHFEGYDLSKRHHLDALNAVFKSASLQDKDLVDVFLLHPSKNDNGLSLLFQKINKQALESNQAQLDALITTIYQISLEPLYNQKHLQLKAMLHYVMTSPASDTLKTEILADIWTKIGMKKPEDIEAKDIFLSCLTQTINKKAASELIPKGFTNGGFIFRDDYWIKTTFIIQLMKLADFKEFLLPSPQTIGLSGFETRVIPFFTRLTISDEDRQLLLSALSSEELIPLVCNNILNPLLDIHLRDDSDNNNNNALMARYVVEQVIAPQVIKDEAKLRFFLQTYKNFPQVLGYMANQLPAYRSTILEFLVRSNFDLFFRYSPADESRSSLIALWNEQILPRAQKAPKLLAGFMRVFVGESYITSYPDLFAEPHFIEYLSSFLMTDDFDPGEKSLFELFKPSYVAQYELIPLVSALLIEKYLPQKLKGCSDSEPYRLPLLIDELMDFLEKLHLLIDIYPDKKELVLREIENYLQGRGHVQDRDRNLGVQWTFSRHEKLRWFLLSYAYHVPAECVATLNDFEFLVKLRALKENDSDFPKEAAFIELYPNCENTLVGLLNRTAVVKRDTSISNEKPKLSSISPLFTMFGGSATRVAYRVQEHKKHLSLEQLQECTNGCPDPFKPYATVRLTSTAYVNHREPAVVLPASMAMIKSDEPVNSYPQHADQRASVASLEPAQTYNSHIPVALATLVSSAPYPDVFFPAMPETEIRPRNRNEEGTSARQPTLAL